MAILAVLGVSLVASAEAGATTSSWDWNKFYSDSPDTSDPKSVISSGHTGQSITEGAYNGVTFGYAYYEKNDTVDNIKSCNNEGTIDSGVITRQGVVGGLADYHTTITPPHGVTVQANGNKVTFKNGSSFETALSHTEITDLDKQITGGYARVYYSKEGSAEASGNEVVIEKGFSLKMKDNESLTIRGGCSYVLDLTANESTASNNKVKIYDLTIDGSTNHLKIWGGRAVAHKKMHQHQKMKSIFPARVMIFR